MAFTKKRRSSFLKAKSKKGREGEKKRERERDRQTDRQTDRQRQRERGVCPWSITC